LINEVFGAGRTKLIQESNLALAALAGADGGTIAAAFKRGQVLLRSGLSRERAMLKSIGPLVPGDKDAMRLIGLRVREEKEFVDSLFTQFGTEYSRRCRELKCQPREAAPSAEERELDGLVPKPVPGIMGTSAYFGNYYEKVLGKEKLESFRLAPDFSYGHVGYTEAHNFIDGQRSILEIHQAVESELWSEGYPAAHGISLREVASYMRMLEAAKVITLEKRAAKNPGREVSHD
jgi:hypothetical protein